MLSYFDVLNANTNWWDVVEFKLLSIFITVVLAVLVGNWLHDRNKK